MFDSAKIPAGRKMARLGQGAPMPKPFGADLWLLSRPFAATRVTHLHALMHAHAHAHTHTKSSGLSTPLGARTVALTTRCSV